MILKPQDIFHIKHWLMVLARKTVTITCSGIQSVTLSNAMVSSPS